MGASYFTVLQCASTARPLARLNSDTPILSDVPCVMQGTDYSCGAASLQAVLSYWGVDRAEEELMDRLHTSPHNGTHPEDIVRVAQELGFDAIMDGDLTVRDLALSVQEGVPIIIVAQAWADDHSADFSWDDDWEHGHYMVVIGIDDERVYLEDPALEGCRGIIPLDEFNDRWHNYIGDSPTAPGTVLVQHLGVFITRS